MATLQVRSLKLLQKHEHKRDEILPIVSSKNTFEKKTNVILWFSKYKTKHFWQTNASILKFVGVVGCTTHTYKLYQSRIIRENGNTIINFDFLDTSGKNYKNSIFQQLFWFSLNWICSRNKFLNFRLRKKRESSKCSYLYFFLVTAVK